MAFLAKIFLGLNEHFAMGESYKGLLKRQSCGKLCYPRSTFDSLDKDKWPSDENGLICDFQILPEKLQRGVDDGSWFWWCDAQFVPFKDNLLVATTSAFRPRVGVKWHQVPNTFNGRVQLIHLADPQHIESQVFSRTNSTVFPKLQPHPLGELVGYCGTGEVAILTLDGYPAYSRSRDLSNAVHVYCAVAKNGVYLACIKRGMGTFFLETSVLDYSVLGEDSVRCDHICPGFTPHRYASEFVACKFSPDSKYIAVSSSAGQLFVVTKFKLERHQIVCPDLVEDALSAAEAFDYNPRYPHEVIVVGTKTSKLVMLNIDTEDIGQTAELESPIDCVRYSLDGKTLAVGTSDLDIYIFEGQELDCLYRIPMSELCDTEIQRRQTNFPMVLNLSFSQDGGHLVSTSCGGRARVWRMRRVFTLQELCRNSILSRINVNDVQRLKMLPNKLHDFLMYTYF